MIQLAPNGKKSNLTAEQYKLVRTPEFKQWFGDWEKSPKTSSKVIDENGEPMIVYHGSYFNFNVFDRNKLSPIYDELTNEIHNTGGFYFTDDFEISSSYKNRRPNKHNNRWNYVKSYLYSHKVKAYFVKLVNPLVIQGNGKSWHKIKTVGEWIYSTDDVAYETFTEGKHDGVIFYNIYDTADADKYLRTSNSFVAFYSNQIKLADGTNTTFDGKNYDVRFDNGGIINDKGIFYSLGTAKELGITPNIKGHDMVAKCDCGAKFSYQNLKKNALWECPECNGAKRIKTF